MSFEIPDPQKKDIPSTLALYEKIVEYSEFFYLRQDLGLRELPLPPGGSPPKMLPLFRKPNIEPWMWERTILGSYDKRREDRSNQYQRQRLESVT
jgi:hypothetical protein